VPSPAAIEHQELFGWLYWLLRGFALRNGGKALLAPFPLKFQSMPRGREPDLMFLGPQRNAQLHRTYVEGPVDIVVEIVSPESLARDRGLKFEEYETEGIPEYWLLDPIRHTADFTVLVDGRYQRAPLDDDVFYSRSVPGLAIPVSWLWEDPLPEPSSCLDRMEQLGRARRS
jgi:Uma2 family endonuclease